MSCQRCGGVVAAELAAAMYKLVCERGVIENRYCHCDEVDRPVQADLHRDGGGTLAEKPPEISMSEGGTP